jgi:autotransporter-associated beta strand protein
MIGRYTSHTERSKTMGGHHTRLTTAIAAVLASTAISQAATYTWDAAAGGNWNADANWTGTGFPGTAGANDVASIGTISSNITMPGSTVELAQLNYSGTSDRSLSNGTGQLINWSNTDSAINGGLANVNVTGTGILTITTAQTVVSGETLEKTGTGRVSTGSNGATTWGGTNTLQISGGTYEVTHERALGGTTIAPAISVASGATFQFTGANGKTLGGTQMTLGGTGIGGTGAFRFTSTTAGNITVNNNIVTTTSDTTIANAMGGTLSGAFADRLNSFGGAISGNGGLVLDSSAFGGSNYRTGFVLTGATANTFSGSTSVKGGVLELAKNSGTDAITAGGVIVDGATLYLRNTNQINDNATVTLNNGGIFSLSRPDNTTANNDQIAKLVVNNGSLAFVTGSTSSRLMLGAGGTTNGLHLNAGGELEVNNTFGTAFNFAGGTLSGRGTLSNAITVPTTGVVAPSSDAGAIDDLDFAGGLTLNGEYDWNLQDLLDVTGAFTLGASSVLDVLDPLDPGTTYTIAQWTTAGLPGTFGTVDDVVDDTHNIVYGQNAITLVPVPEPACLGLLMIGSVLAGRRRAR